MLPLWRITISGTPLRPLLGNVPHLLLLLVSMAYGHDQANMVN